jgi:hypothetical protein
MSDAQVDSIFVVTFHKTASTFFADYVIHQIPGLTPVDYASQLVNDKLTGDVVFHEHGYAYGVLRLAPFGPEYERVIRPFIADRRLRACKTLFLVRDPRDILVSMYYSFGKTHALAENPEMRALQAEMRGAAQVSSVAAYALQEAQQVVQRFAMMRELVRDTPRKLIVRYEDMIHDFDRFWGELQPFLGLMPAARARLYAETRPQLVERPDQHKRLGKTGNYREKFDAATIAELNRQFAEILPEYGYSP